MSRDRDLTSDPSAEHLADREPAQAELDAADARSGGGPDRAPRSLHRRRARAGRRGDRQQRRLGRPRAPLARAPGPAPRSRTARSSDCPSATLQDRDAVGSPRRPAPRRGPGPSVRYRDAVREDVLAERELPDEDRADVVREVLGRTRVDLRVTLAVVADEDPLHVRELRRTAGAAAVTLCDGPLRNQPLFVGPQSVSRSGPGGVAPAAQEAADRRRGVPRARRSGRPRAHRGRRPQLVVQARHPRARARGRSRAAPGRSRPPRAVAADASP